MTTLDAEEWAALDALADDELDALATSDEDES